MRKGPPLEGSPYGALIGCSLDEVLPEDVIASARDLKFASCGFDALRNPMFWEYHVAMRLGGVTTPHKSSHDIDVEIRGQLCLGEVKFSNAFYADYGEYSRHVFRWALTKPQERDRAADVVILVGMAVDQTIYSWTVPITAFPSSKRVMTVSVPSDRLTTKGGRIDKYSCPMTELLPSFAYWAREAKKTPDMFTSKLSVPSKNRTLPTANDARLGSRQVKILTAARRDVTFVVTPKTEPLTYTACMRLRAQGRLERVDNGFMLTSRGEEALLAYNAARTRRLKTHGPDLVEWIEGHV